MSNNGMIHRKIITGHVLFLIVLTAQNNGSIQSKTAVVIVHINPVPMALTTEIAQVVCSYLPPPDNGNAFYSNGYHFGSTVTFSCDSPYTLIGSNFLHCGMFGQWSGSSPSCQFISGYCGGVVPCVLSLGANCLIFCDSIPSIANGNIVYTDGQFQGSVASFSCNTGYSLIGSNSRTCASDGLWSGDSPSCQLINCGSLSSPTNGEVDLTDGTTHNSVAVFTCNNGFTLTGSATRTCQDNTNWSHSSPSCILTDCGALTVPANGNIDNMLTTYQQSVTFSCNTGYSLDGAATLTCEALGAWSATEPICTIVDCGNLNAPTDGGIDISGGTTFTQVATFSCSAGYDLTGSVTRTCEASGSWSGANPICTIKDCGAMATISNGALTYVSGVTTYGARAQYVCNNGFDLIGTATFLCQSDGTWSGTEPSCSIRDCGGVTAPTGGSVTLSSGTTFGSKATFSCDTGYTLTGTASINCLATGNWDESEPICVIKDCGILTAPANGALSYSSGTTYSSIATFICNTGYTLDGDTTSICEETSAWSANPPTCIIMDCGAVTTPTNGAINSQTGSTFQSTVTFSCVTGYDLLGSSSITCQNDGSWSDAEPICNIKDCGTLSTPTNGALTLSSSTTYSSQATFTCDMGYTRIGSATLTCLADGSWSGSEPTCQIVDCGSLSTPTNGAQNGALTTYGSTVTFTCDTGYTINGDTSTLCQADGSWSHAEPTCVINDCGTLTVPTDGVMSNPSGLTTYGTTVTFTCDTGYNLVGSASIICQSDSTWSDTVPICSIKDCGALAAPDDGLVDTPGGTTYQAVAIFSCNTGYTLVGAATRSCQSTGTWSSTDPTCQINDCGTLPQPTNGVLTTPGGTTYNSVAFYTCNLGYTLVGVVSRTCQDDFTWSSTAPVCQINDCGTLNALTDGDIDLSGGTTYQSVAKFTCNTGYTLTGSATRTCQDNSDWSDTSPICVIKDCGTLVAPSDGAVDLSGGTQYLSQASFTCDPGYSMWGSNVIVCQQDGTWTGSAPTCTIKDCGSLSSPTNGEVDLTDGTTYNSMAVFTCNTGFTLTGSTTRICQDDRNWSNSSPSCIIKDCGSLNPPLNGNVDLTGGTHYSSVAVFSCHIGFELTGSSTRKCLDDTNWSSTSPTCTIKDCGNLSSPTNGEVDLTDGTTYNSVAVYTCYTGFRLTGSATRICQDDKNWSKLSPSCFIKDCGKLLPPSNCEVNFTHGTTFESVAVYTCKEGFELKGPTTRKCQDDKSWSNSNPICILTDSSDSQKSTNTLMIIALSVGLAATIALTVVMCKYRVYRKKRNAIDVEKRYQMKVYGY